MLTVAIDTATDRCTVAASNGARIVARHLDGARRHAAALPGLFDALLVELGATPRDITTILTADGPGSFTGLRVGATVANALAWRSDVQWRIAPSLLVRAVNHVPPGGGRVLAVADALRGELYAGCWMLDADEVTTVLAPRTVHPADLAALGIPDVVVGTIPPALLDAVREATGREPTIGEAALPDARGLLALDQRRGGTTRVAEPGRWEPVYGRPAEAQTVWEAKHGVPLPHPTDRLG